MTQTRAQSSNELLQQLSLKGIALALVCGLSAEIILEGLSSAAGPSTTSSAGRIIIVFLAIYCVNRFFLVTFRNFRPLTRDFSTVGAMVILTLLVIWLGRVFAIGITSYTGKSPLFTGLSVQSLHYTIPFAAGALLLQAVLGPLFAMYFGMIVAAIHFMYFPSEPVLGLYVLCTSLIASISLSRFRSRSAYTKAGLNVAVVGLPFAFCSIALMSGFFPSDIVVGVLGVFVNGLLCAFLAAGLTPTIEYLGGYITDMRLIEMATLDHPLLKELSIQAPGTWNHSMVMGMMTEAAADAIGANSIIARVGAYFHDIGKTKKPLYFVENQVGGENRHDKLSPSMSALIIRSHVKDGIELAKKHGLPQVIEDMIPQHHGTSLIEYFFDKASKEAKEADGPVDESLYTYPGPKPQTKEAGILMLADGIEAAARTLSEPNLDRIQGLVQKLINKVFSSGELDECELTLNHLHQIAKCFTRILNGIYHQRIAYAEPAEKISERAREEGEQELADSSAEKKGREPREAKDGNDKGDSKEDLKRLGME